MSNKQSWIQLFVAASLGAIFSWFVQGRLNETGAMHQNTQDLMIAFQQDFYGQHRNKIFAFANRPQVLALIRNETSEDQFRKSMLSLIEADNDMKVSIFALADFYRTVSLCIDIRRCNKADALSLFAPYAHNFYELFSAVLRDADCNLRYPDAEGNVARIARVVVDTKTKCQSQSR